jgi:hypothetical protein
MDAGQPLDFIVNNHTRIISLYAHVQTCISLGSSLDGAATAAVVDATWSIGRGIKILTRPGRSLMPIERAGYALERAFGCVRAYSRTNRPHCSIADRRRLPIYHEVREIMS